MISSRQECTGGTVRISVQKIMPSWTLRHPRLLKNPPNYLKQTGTSGQPVSGGQPWVTSGGPLNATAASTWTALATCYNPLAALFAVFLVLSLLSDNLFCVLSPVFLK